MHGLIFTETVRGPFKHTSKISCYFPKLLRFQANFENFVSDWWNWAISIQEKKKKKKKKRKRKCPMFISVALNWKGHRYTRSYRRLILRPISVAWSPDLTFVLRTPRASTPPSVRTKWRNRRGGGGTGAEWCIGKKAKEARKKKRRKIIIEGKVENWKWKYEKL